MRQYQKLLQFIAEEGTAVFAARWEIKSQGGQCVDDTEAAHVASVQGLYTHNPDHNLCRNAVTFLGQFKPLGMGLPKRQARMDAVRFHKSSAVGSPVFGGACRRRHDGLAHGGNETRAAQDVAHGLRIQLLALCHGIGEQHHVFASAVGHGHWGAVVFYGGVGAFLLCMCVVAGSEEQGGQHCGAYKQSGHRGCARMC